MRLFAEALLIKANNQIQLYQKGLEKQQCIHILGVLHSQGNELDQLSINLDRFKAEGKKRLQDDTIRGTKAKQHYTFSIVTGLDQHTKLTKGIISVRMQGQWWEQETEWGMVTEDECIYNIICL